MRKINAIIILFIIFSPLCYLFFYKDIRNADLWAYMFKPTAQRDGKAFMAISEKYEVNSISEFTKNLPEYLRSFGILYQILYTPPFVRWEVDKISFLTVENFTYADPVIEPAKFHIRGVKKIAK